MCGIMGFVRTAKAPEGSAAAIAAVLAAIEERGAHASGYAALFTRDDGNDYMASTRAPIPSGKLVEQDKKLPRRIRRSRLFIGHARYATHGDPKDNRNNHPHCSEDMRFAVVHNGVIRGKAAVKCKTACDSEKVLRLLEKHGPKAGFAAIAKIADADYALLVIDSAHGSMYAVRRGRPLVYSDCTDSLGGIVFASTEAILSRALLANGVVPPEIIEVDENVLYRWRAGKGAPVRVAKHPAPRAVVWSSRIRPIDPTIPRLPARSEPMAGHLFRFEDDGTVVETDSAERYSRWLKSNSGRTN